MEMEEVETPSETPAEISVGTDEATVEIKEDDEVELETEEDGA